MCVISIIFGVSEYTIFINVRKNAFTSFSSTSITHSIKSHPLRKKFQSNCTYEKNINVYMDSFKEVTSDYFQEEYQRFLLRSRQCKPMPGGGHCLFNNDNPSSDALFYYAPVNLNFKRVFRDQIVVVFTMEPENGQLPSSIGYDMKVSYRRDSTIPTPFLCKYNRALRLVEMGQPDVPVDRYKLIASFIKNCNVHWRVDYLKDLMKYIHVDQWGKCLKNTPGDFFKTRSMVNHEKPKIDFIMQNRYKFLIAFENSINPDYVSEKVYQAYLTRTIPIYYGDKAVFDLIPANTSLIYANDYSPKELAELIQHIANNETLYSQYFTNWDLNKMHKFHEQYCLEHFICATCREVWSRLYERKCIMK